MIIVLCPNESNRHTRWKFDENTIREYGYWKDNPLLLNMVDEFKFMPSTKLQTKLPVMACTKGHINIIQRIIDEDLQDVLIVEDDSVIDYERFTKFLQIDKPYGLIYLGGRFDYPKIKDWDKERSIETYMKGKSVNGFNSVTYDFIITGTHGYFIQNKDIAQQILNTSKGKTGKYKSNLTDVMLSKTDIKKYYYYPSIVEVEYLPSLLDHNCPESTWRNYVS